jgi:uncharacterized membrane protein YfcA
MPPEPSLTIIIVCSLVCLAAATIAGFSGFGFALISVPLLALVLDIKFLVPLELLLASFCLIILTINKLRFLKDLRIYVILAGMVVGLKIGTNILADFDVALLKKMLAVVVFIFAAHIFFRRRDENGVEPSSQRSSLAGMLIALPVGLLAGILGGVFGTSGPPLVVYMDHFAENKSDFRAQLLVIFLLMDVFRVIFYIQESLLTMEVVKFTLWMLPALSLGILIGSKMHFRVNEKTFGRAISCLLFGSGLLLLMR